MKRFKQAEYAAHRGITQQRVSKMIKDGKLAGAVERAGGQWRIDPERADELLSQRLDKTAMRKLVKKPKKKVTKKITKKPAKKIVPKSPPKKIQEKIKTAGVQGMTLAQAQTLQAQYKAALLKLKYEKEKGELVDREQTEKDFFSVGRIVRDSLLNIPDRLAPEFAAIQDIHLIRHRMIEEITHSLEELCREKKV